VIVLVRIVRIAIVPALAVPVVTVLALIDLVRTGIRLGRDVMMIHMNHAARGFQMKYFLRI